MGLLAALGFANVGVAAGLNQHNCQLDGVLCTETVNPIGYWGTYTGHDEPSLLFHSDTPGSGNNMVYVLRLPADPPTLLRAALPQHRGPDPHHRGLPAHP